MLNTKQDNYHAVGIDFKPFTFEMHGATSETLVKTPAVADDVNKQYPFLV